ncbi:MAG: hypothetical protein CMP77_09710 [Flavobacterium sp.]|nr:hypothetical protein [Flavobacterium sp.]
MKQFDDRIIDRTNKFYLEMSRKVLTVREYEIMHKLLIEKKTSNEVSELYGLTNERIRQIYQDTFRKVKNVTGVLDDIDHYKKVLTELKKKCSEAEGGIMGKHDNATVPDLEKLLNECNFPFSKRMYSFFELLEVNTIGELSVITLKEFNCLRGFKSQLKKELIAFIEFENIENLFDGFQEWKDN